MRRPLLVTGLLLAGVVPASAQTAPPVPALLEADFLLSVGEIVDPERWRDAEAVVGVPAENPVTDRSQTQYDLVYVPRVVAGAALTPGDRIQFFRLDRRIDDPATAEPLGTLLLPTGVGRVDSLAGETARVRVTDAFHPILVGDRVRVVTGELASRQAEGPVGSGPGGRVVAFQEKKAVHPPFDKLFLRPEVAGSTAAGQVVELYRPGVVRDGVRLPDQILGKAMIVRPDGQIAAAVTYELELSDLAPGDLYRPVLPDRD